MVENVVRNGQKICLRNGRQCFEKWTKRFVSEMVESAVRKGQKICRRNGRKCCEKWKKYLYQ